MNKEKILSNLTRAYDAFMSHAVAHKDERGELSPKEEKVSQRLYNDYIDARISAYAAGCKPGDISKATGILPLL